MDDLGVKSKKKKVTFGKARVRLVFDYYDDDPRPDEDTDERTSREIHENQPKPIPAPLKPPKSILKPTMKAISLESGLNAIQGRPKRNFEWETKDRNFWEPERHRRIGKRRESYLAGSNTSESQSRSSTYEDEVLQKRHAVTDQVRASIDILEASKNDQKTKTSGKDASHRKDTRTKNEDFKEDRKTSEKQKDLNNNFGEIEAKSMASGPSEMEEDASGRAVKDTTKWKGSESHGKGLKTFESIYSGVEADWDQTRQSLSRIGVNVGEEKLQNPRDFVSIMNLLLSLREEKERQESVGTEQADAIGTSKGQEAKTLGHKEISPSSSARTKKQQHPIPEDHVLGPSHESHIIKEKINTNRNISEREKPSLTKEELKKRIKKLKIKGLIPVKRENTSKRMTRERSYSENNLKGSTVTIHDKYSSMENFRRGKVSMDGSKSGKEKRERRIRSRSAENLDGIVRKFEREKTIYENSSMEDVNVDEEPSASSTDNDASAEKYYSDNDLDLPKKAGSFDDRRESRDRSFSSAKEMNSGQESQHKARPRVVKRDSWFLTRKQKMANESEETSDTKLKKADERKKRDLKRQLKDSSHGMTCSEAQPPGSTDLNNNSGESENQECDVPRSQLTLLMMANQSESEREDCELATPNDSGLSSVNDEISNEKGVEKLDESWRNKPEATAEQVPSSELGQSSNENHLSGTMVETTDGRNEVDKTSPATENQECSDRVKDSQVSPVPSGLVPTAQLHEKALGTRASQEEPDHTNVTPRNAQGSRDKITFEKQFQDDIGFINIEAKKCMKNMKYVEKVKQKYLAQTRESCLNLENSLALRVTKAIHKNPAVGILLPFLN